MTDNMNSNIEATKAKITSLQSELDRLRSSKRNTTLQSMSPKQQQQTTATTAATTNANSTGSSSMELLEIRAPPATKVRRTLKGHFGKVTAVHWAGDSQSLASASQDGKLLLWNALTTNKLKSISLKSPYVMTVGMEQTQGRLVACGGLDNLVTVYKWDDDHTPSRAQQEMAHHDGFVSCVRFVKGESQLVSSSGDSSLVHWDVSTGRVVSELKEHTADVMCFALDPSNDAGNTNVLASGSVDRTVKLWDLRTPRASVQSFSGFHTGDINGVDFLHHVVATASEDGTSQLLDVRSSHNSVATLSVEPRQQHSQQQTSGGEQQQQQHEAAIGGAEQAYDGLTSVSFSKSGRILFAGHSNSTVVAWDVLGNTSQPAFFLTSHEKYVSDIGVNPNGDALCTASWDSTLKIWA